MTGAVMITGATGFIGQALSNALDRCGVPVVRVVRTTLPSHSNHGHRVVIIDDIGPNTDWTTALTGVDCIVHCAARVHMMRDKTAESLAAFRAVNTEGTLHLAREAAAVGVRRFIFLSSIKVNGDSTPAGRPFHASDAPSPRDPYGISKNEAEDGLRQLSTQTSMEHVIVRPPLVYGPGVKANFAAMVRWIESGIPLPLGGVEQNRRSLVSIDNLVDLLIKCIEHPLAANETFLGSDGHDLSTADLLRRMAASIGKRARLISVSTTLLRFAALAVGQSAVAQRLLGSLQVDIRKTRQTLNWSPPVSVDEGLRRAIIASPARTWTNIDDRT